MEYLHTMVRVADLGKSLEFYTENLGLAEMARVDNEAGRYTLVFLAAPGDAARAKATKSPLLELTYNWDSESYGGGRNFGHLAFAVDDIYATCDRLMKAGVAINRPPRDGHMAFIRSPDAISIELLQKGEPKPKQEPWASMPNIGVW
ncbi:MAG: VOC family protein [Methylocella sp.]